MPAPLTIVHRDAVRLLLVDADGRLLLQHCIPLGDGREFHQRERYHVLRVHAFEPVPGCLSDFEPVPGCLSDFEREPMREQRSWRYEDLRAVAPLLNPPELPELLARIRASDMAAPESDASAAATQ